MNPVTGGQSLTDLAGRQEDVRGSQRARPARRRTRALDHAGVSADTIGYLEEETHGTGTLKGDPIELEGARAAYRQDTDRTGYCASGPSRATSAISTWRPAWPVSSRRCWCSSTG
ncbi:hypothetical protein SMICM304S_01767 [Streptomyces microflavus]